MARKAMAKSSFTVEVTVSPNESTDVEKSADLDESTFSRTAEFQIAKSEDADRREVVCVAMVANEIDAHGDLFTPEAVEFAAHNFLAQYNVSKDIGRDHSGERPDIDLIGSWYTEAGGNFDGLEAPPHSWVAKCKVNDDATWQDVKDGKLTGFSIEGPAWLEQPADSETVSKSADSGGPSDDAEMPKRRFAKADPNKLDLVNQGANLRVLVWKAKDVQEMQNTETEKPGEVVVVPVEKAEKPIAVATPEPTPEQPPEQVEKASEAAPEPVADVEKAKSVTPKRAEKLRSLALLANELADDLAGASEGAPEHVEKAAQAPEVAPTVDVAALVAEQVAKALEPLAAAQAELAKQLGAISGARPAQAGAPDDDAAERVAKSKEDPSRPFNGVMSGVKFAQ